MDEDRALATLLAYKGRKDEDKDYLAMAQAARYLKQHYGSYAQAAKRVGTYTGETLRELAKLLDLPDAIKDLIRSRALRQDAHKILLVKPTFRQIELAQALVGLSTDDARAVLEYVRKNPKLPVEECKRRVLESKTVKEKIVLLVVPLSDDDYTLLKGLAAKRQLSVDDLVTGIIKTWLQKEQ